MHDCNGNPVRVGDRVALFGTIAETHGAGEYCNVRFVSDRAMPGNGERCSISALNASQVLLVEKAPEPATPAAPAS
jgi:hypothetical protein